MKLVGAISTAVLSLSLGIGIPAYAQEQHEQQENKDKPAQEKEKKAQPEKPAKQEEKSAQQNKSNAQEEKNAKQQEQHTPQAKPEQQAQRSGGNGGRRIPDDRFRANFGEGHRFHLTESNYRDRRFQYGGYWFGFDSVWPSNWLYTQDVYVVDIDGVYYLCNANYPGVNIMLSVTL
jgi:hypothetical protein